MMLLDRDTVAGGEAVSHGMPVAMSFEATGQPTVTSRSTSFRSLPSFTSCSAEWQPSSFVFWPMLQASPRGECPLYNRVTMNLRAKSGIVSLLFLLLTLVMHAEPVSQLHPTGYVNDFAHVLDQKTVAQMESICQQTDLKAHAQIAVVTINSIDGKDIESYARDLFNSWGIGDKSTNRGVLILYAMKEHRSRIEIGYGMETILPDDKVGGFQREAIPLMRNGDTSAALQLVTKRVASLIAQDEGMNTFEESSEIEARNALHFGHNLILQLLALQSEYFSLGLEAAIQERFTAYTATWGGADQQ
jgi:uncharacterized protein